MVLESDMMPVLLASFAAPRLSDDVAGITNVPSGPHEGFTER